jgi:hypothetical protein
MGQQCRLCRHNLRELGFEGGGDMGMKLTASVAQ